MDNDPLRNDLAFSLHMTAALLVMVAIAVMTVVLIEVAPRLA